MSAFEIKTLFNIELVCIIIQLFHIIIHCATYTVRKLIHVRQSSMIFLCSTLLYSRRLSTMGENKFWRNIIIIKKLFITPSWSVAPIAKLSCLLQALLMQNWVVKVLKGLILHQESRFLESCLESQLYDVWISLLNLFDSIVI